MSISLSERIATAAVSGIAAALTLALYPLALVIAGRGTGGGSEWQFGAVFYSFVFSAGGLSVVLGAFIAGFILGSDRMANIFSFFWGTHPFWSRGNERFDEFRTDHNLGLWVLIALLAILAAVMVHRYA